MLWLSFIHVTCWHHITLKWCCDENTLRSTRKFTVHLPHLYQVIHVNPSHFPFFKTVLASHPPKIPLHSVTFLRGFSAQFVHCCRKNVIAVTMFFRTMNVERTEQQPAYTLTDFGGKSVVTKLCWNIMISVFSTFNYNVIGKNYS